MKKLIEIHTASELPQGVDRRSPLISGVFSLASDKPKADRRKGMACEMFRLPFLQPHFAASLGRVAPIGGAMRRA